MTEDTGKAIGLWLLIGIIIGTMYFTNHKVLTTAPDRKKAGATSNVPDNIDFGPYMSNLQRKIKSHWLPPKSKLSKQVVVRFKVYRDGHISDLQIFKSSAIAGMDQAAINAINQSNPFSPLPAGAPASVDIEFTLDYNVFGHQQSTFE